MWKSGDDLFCLWDTLKDHATIPFFQQATAFIIYIYNITHELTVYWLARTPYGSPGPWAFALSAGLWKPYPVPSGVNDDLELWSKFADYMADIWQSHYSKFSYCKILLM